MVVIREWEKKPEDFDDDRRSSSDSDPEEDDKDANSEPDGN